MCFVKNIKTENIPSLIHLPSHRFKLAPGISVIALPHLFSPIFPPHECLFNLFNK